MGIDLEEKMNVGIAYRGNIDSADLRIYADGCLYHGAGQQNKPEDDRLDDLVDGAAQRSHRISPLQRRFEIIAQTTPGAPALRCGARHISYGELDVEADELALHLQRGGLRRGSFCLLGLAPAPARVRAILAVLKAGGACLECDPALSALGVAAVMRLLQPALLFLHGGDTGAPPMGGMPVVRCDDEAAQLPHGWPDEAPVRAATPAHAVAAPCADGATCVHLMSHRWLADAAVSIRTRSRPDGSGDPVALWAALSTGAALALPARA